MLGRCRKYFGCVSLNWKLHIQGITFYHIFWCSMTQFVRFRLLAEIFWRVYWNCFLQALRIVLTEEMFFRTKQCFLKNFGVRAKKVLDLRQKKLQDSQTSIGVAQRNIWKNTMFQKEIMFCLFQTLNEKRWENAQKTFGCVL